MLTLSSLVALKHPNLAFTDITDVRVQSLSSLVALQHLDLWVTFISDVGAQVAFFFGRTAVPGPGGLQSYHGPWSAIAFFLGCAAVPEPGGNSHHGHRSASAHDRTAKPPTLSLKRPAPSVVLSSLTDSTEDPLIYSSLSCSCLMSSSHLTRFGGIDQCGCPFLALFHGGAAAPEP